MAAAQAASVLRTGWARAALSASVVLAIVYALNLVLAWLLNEAAPSAIEIDGRGVPNPVALLPVPRVALTSLMSWHGVSFGVDVGLPQSQAPFGSSIEVGITATLMLGLAICGYLLFRTGKALAARTGADGWLSGIRGLQIALFYGVFVFALSFLARLEVPLGELFSTSGEGPQSLTLRPSLFGAFLMPFLLASFAAGAGALSGRWSPRERLTRMALAAVSGGWRAAWLVVALSSIGFLIVAALHPDATRAFLDLLPGGKSQIFLVLSTLLFVPNVGVGIAAASMGGSINFAPANDACAVISYLQFPGGALQSVPGLGELSCGLQVAFGPAPFQYMLFLLIPLAAAIAGGWLASQRAGATDAEAGAMAGATIAIPYAVWLWVLALMARLGYTAAVGVEIQVWIGPGLVSTFLVALAWGLGGGAIGGALGARNASGPGINPGPPTNDSV